MVRRNKNARHLVEGAELIKTDEGDALRLKLSARRSRLPRVIMFDNKRSISGRKKDGLNIVEDVHEKEVSPIVSSWIERTEREGRRRYRSGNGRR